MSITEIRTASSMIILSKGKPAFQQVLDDFPNAERITVVTFNVSASDRSLLDALSQASSTACVICNIPKRFDTYFGKNVAQSKLAAKKQIDSFLLQLDPARYQTVFETYFAFRNHAKIVMTENIAYVGSANFSSESNRNWECGVIVEDANAIVELALAVEQIKADSIRYLGASTDLLVNTFATLQSFYDDIWSGLSEGCLDELASVLDDIEGAVAQVDMPWAFAFESGGPLTSRIDMALIRQLQQLIGESTRLREWAKFDQYEVQVDDFPSDAYEERLQAYLESAGAANAQRLENLEDAAKEDLHSLQTGVETLCDQIRAVLRDIADNKSKIDNTQE